MQDINDIFNKSKINESYLRILSNPEIKIVSFDIFDTLVYRNVAKPIDIFLNVGKNKNVRKIFSNAGNFQEMRIFAEEKAREDNKEMGEITLELIYSYFHLTKQKQKQIMKLEILEEKKSLSLNNHIIKWIENAILNKKKVIFISDFYLDKNNLRYIFSDLSIDIIDKVTMYISCDLKKTKFKGDMFDDVLIKENIQAHELFHIGDNLHSDYNIPIKKGIRALFYNSSDYLRNVYKQENNYSTQLNEIWNNIGHQASICNPYSDPKNKFFYDLGAGLFGSILWGFTHWLLKICKKDGIKQINCLMREGQLFAKCLNLVAPKFDINIVFASRKSTFLASLNPNQIKNREFNFYGYEDFKLKDLYELFDLTSNNDFIISNYEHYFSSKNLFTSEEFKILSEVSTEFSSKIDEIVEKIKNKKHILNLYFEQMGINKNSILLDFGGKGTILRTLSSSLKKDRKSKIHALFYKNNESFKKNVGYNFISYLKYNQKNKEKSNIIQKSPAFIEVLFNGNYNTTLDYKIDNNQNVIPLLEENSQSSQVLALDAFERGITVFFKLALEQKLSPRIFKKNHMLSRLARLIDLPLKEEALFLGSLIHEAGFGSTHKFPIINSQHIEWIQEKGCLEVFYKHKKGIALDINNVHWLQGTITCVDSDFLNSFNGNLSVYNSIANPSESVKKLIKRIEEFGLITEVYIYGAGYIFEVLYEYLFAKNIKINGIIDTRAEISKITVKGYNVLTLKKSQLKDDDIIIIASDKFANDIENKICEFVKTNKLNIKIIKI